MYHPGTNAMHATKNASQKTKKEQRTKTANVCVASFPRRDGLLFRQRSNLGNFDYDLIAFPLPAEILFLD